MFGRTVDDGRDALVSERARAHLRESRLASRCGCDGRSQAPADVLVFGTVPDHRVYVNTRGTGEEQV